MLHFAGVPDPATARADPARAVRENAGTTANLLDACREHGCALVYPSTVRAGIDPPPDAYALSKRLGEAACRMHPAPSVVLRTTSVFGPGQVAWEGATGAIASFAARAIEGSPIVIVGDPDRTRDFLYVDDLVGAIETIVTERRWNETFTIASGEPTSLRAAAELVRDAVGSEVEIRIEARELAAGENESYAATPEAPGYASGASPPGGHRHVCCLDPPPSRCSRPRPSLSRSRTASGRRRRPGSSCAWRRDTSPTRTRWRPRRAPARDSRRTASS